MASSQRSRASKSVGASRTSKSLADDGRCKSSGTYQRSARGFSSSYLNSMNGPTASTSVKHDSYVSSRSVSSRSNVPFMLTDVQNNVLGSSEDSGSDFDIETGGGDRPSVLQADDWVNTSAAPLANGPSDEKDVMVVNAGGPARERDQSFCQPSWRDRYMLQPDKLCNNKSTQSDIDNEQFQLTQHPYRKGSSSKAPQTDDLTAPLIMERKTRSFTERTVQGGSEEHSPENSVPVAFKNRIASSVRQGTNLSSMNGDILSRRKGTSQAYYGRRSRYDDVGAGHKDINNNGDGPSRRSLSNFVCSSASDVLPSVSNSMLSSFSCSSAADVLPSASSALSGTTSNLRSRRSSRSLGLLEGEDGRSMDLGKQGSEEASIIDLGESIQNSQEFHRLATEVMAPSSSSSSLLPNNRHWRRNPALPRQQDGLGSLYRSNGTLPQSNPAFGEDFSNQWSARRRSLYGGRFDRTGRDSRSSSRSALHERPYSSTWSVLSRTHHIPPSFPGPPTRPPPLPPTVFSEPSASESSFSALSPVINPEIPPSYRSTTFALPGQGTEPISTAAPALMGSSNLSTSGENRPRLTVEGLSEILSALEFIERDEDLSYEQILMLEATLLLGGIGLHDRYRDMRIDIDNMSYEELLALEERIGNVNTGLSEESVGKSVRVEMFTSPKISCGYVPQEMEIKCSICQEEFEEAVELGILNCGHSHHLSCIKQWLLQKNQCPICKVPALS